MRCGTAAAPLFVLTACSARPMHRLIVQQFPTPFSPFKVLTVAIVSADKHTVHKLAVVPIHSFTTSNDTHCSLSAVGLNESLFIHSQHSNISEMLHISANTTVHLCLWCNYEHISEKDRLLGQ
jgi:hypothetical protein